MNNEKYLGMMIPNLDLSANKSRTLSMYSLVDSNHTIDLYWFFGNPFFHVITISAFFVPFSICRTQLNTA